MNLRQWCIRFLDAKCTDHEAIEHSKLLRLTAKENGFSDDDVSNMLREINNERAQRKIEQGVKQNNTPVETKNEVAQTKRDIKQTVTATPDNRKPRKWKGKSILEMMDEKRKGA